MMDKVTIPAIDWSFGDLKTAETLWGTHGYHRYPAKFIPQLVRQLIELHSEKGALVGDPFLGSATTGVEAIRAGRRFWGSDVNPVAVLISEAKCRPIEPKALATEWGSLSKRLEALPRIGRRSLTHAERMIIYRIDIAHASADERMAYWFPVAHTAVLEEILQQVRQTSDSAMCTLFLCGFSNILRRCSIWLSGSTKPQKDMEKTLSDPVEAFQFQIRDMLRRNQLYWDDLAKSGLSPVTVRDRYQLESADARVLPLPAGELDLLVSSPPYATCYEYTQIHQLTQLWLERHQIIPKTDWQKKCIGSRCVSLRQAQIKQVPSPSNSPSADRAVAELEALADGSVGSPARREASALRYYFQDMLLVIKEFARVVAPNRRMVLIIGDSRKRGINIPTSTCFQEMAGAVGFELEQRIVRRIPGRVLVINRNEKTGRFSSTASSDAKAYPEEDILVFKRLA